MSSGEPDQSLWSSFRHAFAGFWYVLRTQRNAWIHAILTATAFGLAVLVRLDRSEWILLLLVTGMVWVAEIFNTALEALVDLTNPETHPLARVAKDTAAAAVLFAAAVALLVGLLLLGPPLWALAAAH